MQTTFKSSGLNYWKTNESRGVTRGKQFPGRWITMGAQNDCGGTEKSKQFHEYFFQDSIFSSWRPQIRTWGAKLASCLRLHL